jgi:prepilin-type N-terminal cleavage/methylation domain-containing protein
MISFSKNKPQFIHKQRKQVVLRDARGLTLIEVIAAMVILSIVLIPLSNLILQGFKTNTENQKTLDNRIVATGIIEDLKEAVRNSKTEVNIGGTNYSISVPHSNEKLTMNGNDYLLSFSVTHVPPEDLSSLLKGPITKSPTNLYKISLTILQQNSLLKDNKITLNVIIEKNL